MTPSRGRSVAATSRSSGASATGLERAAAPARRARARASSIARARRASRAGLALDVREEAVALDGILLRAGLQHLDRADDRRQRRAQLVRRVRDELALGELAPLLLGQVVETSSALSVSGCDGMPTTPYACSSSGVTCACATRRRSVEEALRELAQREARATARAARRPRRAGRRAAAAPRRSRSGRRDPGRS